MNFLRSRVLAVMTASVLSLTACGGGDDDDTSNNAPTVPTVATVLSGKVVAPDGTTPISNALIYVENSAATANSAAASTCGAPPSTNWPATCTAADGSFTLPTAVPTTAAKLVIAKGAYRQTQDLPAATATMALGNLALSPSSARIAVVTGLFDRIQDVLAKLGYGSVSGGQLALGSETFALYDGDGSLPANYREIEALFVDGNGDGRADIYDYSIVFLNCGLSETVLQKSANRAVLRAYVQGGGRLYVSDQGYDFVEQVFPEYINFEGSTTTSSSLAEQRDAAQIGADGITVNADLDPALSSWLGGVTCTTGSCLNANGTAHLEGFLIGWTVMTGPHFNAPSTVRTWVSGPVSFIGATSVMRPLTVSFDLGAGRVTYTSYHTEPTLDGSTGFLPQERIMQFIVFEL